MLDRSTSCSVLTSRNVFFLPRCMNSSVWQINSPTLPSASSCHLWQQEALREKKKKKKKNVPPPPPQPPSPTPLPLPNPPPPPQPPSPTPFIPTAAGLFDLRHHSHRLLHPLPPGCGGGEQHAASHDPRPFASPSIPQAKRRSLEFGVWIGFELDLEQGCGIKGCFPTSVIQGNPPSI